MRLNLVSQLEGLEIGMEVSIFISVFLWEIHYLLQTGGECQMQIGQIKMDLLIQYPF